MFTPTIHLLLTPGVCGLTSWYNYDTTIIIHVLFLFFRRLVVSLRDTTCTNSCNTCGAGVGIWSSITRYYEGVLERAIRYEDLDFNDEEFGQRKVCHAAASRR
jgi:hypothetical protein